MSRGNFNRYSKGQLYSDAQLAFVTKDLQAKGFEMLPDFDRVDMKILRDAKGNTATIFTGAGNSNGIMVMEVRPAAPRTTTVWDYCEENGFKMGIFAQFAEDLKQSAKTIFSPAR